MHWTLDQVRDMDATEYEELILWAKARAEKRSEGSDPESVDMDAVIDAKRKQRGDA